MSTNKTRADRLLSDQLNEKLGSMETESVGDLYTPVRSNNARFLDALESSLEAEELESRGSKKVGSRGVLFVVFILFFIAALIGLGVFAYGYITKQV